MSINLNKLVHPLIILSALFSFQLAILFLPTFSSSGIAYSQEEQTEPVDKKRPLKGRRVQALSTSVSKIINKANELVELKDNVGARAELDKAIALPK